MPKYKMAWKKVMRRKRPIRRRKARKGAGRRRGGQATTTVNRSLQPIPNRYICKMKYATTVNTDAFGQYIFNMNSLFDPDRSGFGHQPYGFDPLANLYNRYRVISCGWRIQYASGTAATPIIVASLPNNDLGLNYANTGEMLENPRCKYIQQNPSAPVVTLHGKQYLPKLMGRSKSQYMADDNYQAIVTASPTELGLLYLQTFNGFSGAAFPGVGLTVLLEFTVEFFDVKHIAQS